MKSKRVKTPEFEFRTPPHSIEAERSVLGACLLNPDAAVDAVNILCGDIDDLFYIESHRIVFEAIRGIVGSRIPLDPVTLMEYIDRKGQLDEIGGAMGIAELGNAVPTSANLEYYAGLVMDAAQRRKLIITCTRIVGLAYGAADENDEILDTKQLMTQAESEIFKIAEHSQKTVVYNLSDVVHSQCEVIESSVVNRVLTGITTRFTDLDLLTYGLKQSEMTVLAARPSVGKTALALNLAETIAQKGYKVLFVSLEMAKEQLAQRMIYNAGEIVSWQVNQHAYQHSIIRDKLKQADEALSGLPIKLIDSSEITPTQIMGICRRQKAKTGLDMVIVDYLQLITPNNKRLPREQQVSDCAWVMKQISKECACHVILLCQFNREADKDGGRPKLSHLRESGAIEQHCDNALLLSRNEDGTLNCHLAKQRNGVTGEFKLFFNKNTQTFQNIAQDGHPESTKTYPPRAPEIPWRNHTESKTEDFWETENPSYDDGDELGECPF